MDFKKESKLLPFLDTLGVCASSLCLVHCICLPFLIVLLPTIGAKYLGNEFVHHLLAFFVVFFCLSAIVPGYLRHKNRSVLYLMMVGLSVVLFATFFSAAMFGENAEVPVITFGNLFVIGAHFRNRHLCGCMNHAHDHAHAYDHNHAHEHSSEPVI
jgi:hypothetical protein